MSVINATPLLAAAGGDYQISRSVRLRSSASAYFNRTPASAGNRQVMTFSWWMKLGNTAGAIFGAPATTNPRMQIYYNGPSDGRFELYQSDSGGTQVCYTLTTARYRDPSAWYHFVVAIDTTQATAANRIKWYVNGVQLTAFDTAAYPAQNTNMEWNAAAIHNIGRQPNGGSYFDGYLTEINFIDGQALTPSSFGETDTITGVWKPKKYAGTYGTNGFYLNFSDNSSNTATTIGKDNSGNGNNWTPNNISVNAGVTYDSMLDVPTLYADGGNGRGNYSVISPIDKASNIAVAQGNLNVTNSGGGTWVSVRGSAAVSSGKWYWEIDQTYSSGGPLIMGIADAAFNVFTQRAGDTAGSYVLAIDGNKGNNGTFGAYAGGSIASGRNIGVALDLDTGTLVFYNNGVSLGTAYSGISGTFFPVVSVYGTQGGTANFNFGQRPFAYTPPTGFKALNTQNLPEPTIKKGNQFFDATTYTGNGSAQSVVNSGGMQPDLVWVKGRSTAYNHILANTVVGIANFLNSNTTNAESNTAGNITSVNADGFSVGSSLNVNQNAATQVAWQWKESPSAGFDIVTYTGTGSATTVAHSLGVAPKLMFIKARSLAGSGWTTYSSVLGAGQFLSLNATDAATSSIYPFNNTAPTSSVFSVGPTGNGTNNSGVTYVAYLFSEVSQFSKFGSYTGNGSADGPFVFCGFRPRWVLVKASNAALNWFVFDSSRSQFNLVNTFLLPNASDAEGTFNFLDLTSNGFKLRDSGNGANQSGTTYIFAAFAESPFKNSLAR